MKKKHKVILSISGILLVLILSGVLLTQKAGAVYMVYTAHRLVREGCMDVVPQPLDLNVCNTNKTMILQSKDVTFEVPWTDCLLTWTSSPLRWVCSESNIVVLYSPPETCIVSSIVTPLLDNPQSRELLDLDDVVEPNYYMASNAVYTVPSEISFFDPNRKVVKQFLQTMVKFALSCGANSGVYSFNCNDIKGFQIGKLGKDRFVELHIFDSNDGAHNLIVITGNNAPPDILKQEDINTIITTFFVQP